MMVQTFYTGGYDTKQTSVDLNRMIQRLHQTILLPEPAQEARLRRSKHERERIGYNLDYARSLLLRLEQDMQNLKVQTKKQEAQKGLLEKRDHLQRLGERLQELHELDDAQSPHADSSEGEDILGEDTPSETTDEQVTPSSARTPEPTDSPRLPTNPPLSRDLPTISASSATTFPTSTLRSRDRRAVPFSDSHTTGSSTTPRIPTANTETLLTHNRVEQETLTDSLLNMAQALKSSSKALATSLEDEKAVLDTAVEGLDKNETGLEAAQRKMGLLRRYSEGKGWWGRMMLYAWIAGLWLLALVVVFVLPKLRF